MSTRNIKDLAVETGGNTTDLQKALQGGDKQIKEPRASRRIWIAPRARPGQYGTVDKRQKLLGYAVGERKEKLTTLKTAAEQASQALANGDISQL